MAFHPGVNGTFVPTAGPVETVGPRTEAIVWTLTGVAALFLALRLVCKFRQSRGLWWDDHVLVAAWVALVIEAGILTSNVALGFGRHFRDVDSRNLPRMGLQGQVGGLFSIVAVILSKTSFAMTLLRVTEGKTRAFVWFVIISGDAAMALSALFLWIQCTPVAKNWDVMLPGMCWDPEVNVAYGIFAAVYSGIMDWVLSLLPWKVIWKLQMKRKEKMGVGIAMSMGIFAGATALIKASKIPELGNGDFTFDGWHLIVWSAAEAGATIMAASIPVLRVLFREVHHSHRYGSSAHAGRNTATRSNTVTVSTGRDRKGSRASVFAMAIKADDSSDRSILHAAAVAGAGPGSGRIVQTQEVAVEFHARGEPGVENRMQFEMGTVARMV